MHVNVDEAKTQLSKLLELVELGEKVVIARHGKPIAEVVPLSPKSFPFGIASREPLAPPGDEWWKPMTDAEAEDWIKGRCGASPTPNA